MDCYRKKKVNTHQKINIIDDRMLLLSTALSVGLKKKKKVISQSLFANDPQIISYFRAEVGQTGSEKWPEWPSWQKAGQQKLVYCSLIIP